MMRLKETLSMVSEFELVRDAEFEHLGWVRSALPHTLTFLGNEKFLPHLLANPLISGVITTAELLSKMPDHLGVMVTPHPLKTFYQLHNHLANHTDFYWQDFATQISALAKVHARAYVAEKNVRIGKGTVIEPGVTILEHSIIGENVIVRAGVTIGSQGFEFKRIEEKIVSIAHAGGVRIGNGVEIQANGALSRSVFGGFTELGEDTKLDNLVHIAHNVKVGKRCLIAACAMIAGSVTIGDDVWIGPGASLSSEICIGDRASITIGAVVTQNVAAGEKVTGNFAIEHSKYISFLKSIR